MNFRNLIAYSPYLLGVLVVVGLFLPGVSFATDDGLGNVSGFFYLLIVDFTGWLAGVSAHLLNYSINEFVIGFGQFFSDSGAKVAVDELWVLVRDFFNIFFIFGLVFIGFKMILHSDDSQTRSTLVTLIMAALLVNFSLLLTKMVVDFSNILATEVACSAFPSKPGSSGTCESVAVAEEFFRQMGIQETLNAPDPVLKKTASTWSFIFGSGIINIIAAFAFASGGILIIIRFIALTVFMVLSPFMFIGWVLPNFKNMWSKYWGAFLGRAFYAPVFIIMLFFAAKILGSLDLKESIVASGSTAPAFADMLGPFILAAGFLIAAVQVAGKLSADGAGATMKVGSNITKRGKRIVGGSTLGAAAFAGRNTFGRYGYNKANDQDLKDRAASSWVARQQLKLANVVSKSSFDARQVGGIGKSLGVGEGQKGGFDKITKDYVKREEEFVKSLESNIDFDDPETKIKLETLKKDISSKKRKVVHELEGQLKSVEATALRDRENKIASDYVTGKISTNEVSNLKRQIETERKSLNLDEQELYLKLQQADRDVKDAEQIAMGQLKYKNELAYIETLESRERFWKGVSSLPGAIIGGVSGSGAASGTASLLAGAGAGAVTATPAAVLGAGIALTGGGSNAIMAKASYKAIQKKIGKDGRKGIKREKRKDEAKIIKEFLDENTDKPSNDNDSVKSEAA